jgi:TonB dependent receptor/CarboxypepD_reg-like domain/TonB-dependent Receptor Plug Domain
LKLALSLLFSLALACAQQPAGIRGVVLDAQSGESLARVRVLLLATAYQAITDGEGRFELSGVPPGGYILQVSTVGYRLAKKEFHLAEGQPQEFEIILSPDSFRQTDSVEVRAGPFESLRATSLSEHTLVGSELKNLASVLADDPLRAVQALPGVTSDDDFNSRFSVRGADYSRIGLYLDDVLLHSPFHTIQAEEASGTLTIFNGDMVEDMALYSGTPPARYADRSAGALDVHMREGSRRRASFRATGSASNAGMMAEGPLGNKGRGSWMAGIRKSYLQYIVKRTSSDPTLVGGFWDAQGRLSYDLFPRHNLSLSVFEGQSGLDRTDSRDKLGINSVMTSGYNFTLANLGWRYTPSERFFVTSRAALAREKSGNLNRDSLALAGGHYVEGVWNTNATWVWAGQNTLEFGWSLRRRRDNGFSNQYQFNPFAVRRLDEYGGNGILMGGYFQQAFALLGGRLHVSAGGRWDRDSTSSSAALSPQASVTFQPRPSTRLQLGWGEYAQFPELSSLLSRIGGRYLRPERAIHYLAAIEQRLGDRSRLRLELYQRQDRDLFSRPFADPRLIGGRIYNPPVDPPIFNSMRGYARGAEIYFQRRTANRFTGWVSYALSYARVRDGLARVSFPADQDQRHTVNIYGSYRVRPTVNLSTRWVYGSGFPVPGYFSKTGPQYYLAEARNAVRLDPYHRTDMRINKAFVFDRWKLTLYGEAINLTNRANYRYDTFDGYNAKSGAAWPGFNKMLPILPSAGIVWEF